MLSSLEIERITSITNHPGFAALMKLLAEEDEVLLGKLESAHGREAEELLFLWRASRRIRRILESHPTSLAAELGPTADFNDVS